MGTDGFFYGTALAGSSAGTVYKITSSGAFTFLASLPGQPLAPLLLATDGNFYGTTSDGGDSGAGTLFKVTPQGILKVLFNFDPVPFNTTGSAPFGPLVQASNGNFYGTTFQGGSMGGGVVYKATPAGVVTVLHNFDPNDSSEGYAPYAGLVLATDGNLYGVTYYGGGLGVIFEITPAGTYSVLYSFDGTNGGFPAPTPMQSTDGKIYGLTAGGGASNLGVVYSFDNNLQPSLKTFPESAKVGTTVEFLGQGFNGTTSVSFNGTTAACKVTSSTYLTATVPTGATTGFVTVTTAEGQLKSVKQFRVTPQVKSFSPKIGPAGTSVAITGVSFTKTKKVTFGGAKAKFSVISDTQLNATVPTSAATGRIEVTTSGGTADSTSNFKVTP